MVFHTTSQIGENRMLGGVWAEVARRGFVKWYTHSEQFRATELQAVMQALLLPGVRRPRGTVHYSCTEIGWHGDGAEAEVGESEDKEDDFCESYVFLSKSALLSEN